MNTITTARLILRRFRPDDLMAYYEAIFADAEVMKYLPGGQPRPIERAQQVMDHHETTWREHGFGGWAVCPRDDGQLIGHVGLMPTPQAAPAADEIELFYAIARSYWGQGYITEAARAVLADGFTRCGLKRIIAVAVPENIGSRRVMEKLGMAFVGLTTRYYDTELACYTLDAEAWQSDFANRSA